MESTMSQKRALDAKPGPPYEKRQRAPKERIVQVSAPDSSGISTIQACNVNVDENLCRECGKIEFDRWLNTEAIPTGKTLCSLKHVRDISNCRLCRFFTALCMACGQTVPDVKKCRIVVRSTASVFGAKILLHSPCFRLLKGIKDLNGTVLLDYQKTVEPSRISVRCLQRDKMEEDVVKNWLQFCDSVHGPICKIGTLATIPGMRVIDCRSRRLIPFSSHLGGFVTLSYLWGAPSKTHSVVNASLTQHIPKVIADAILVTQRLGFRYLWVDRYCIPQHDHKERHIQISNMGNIYESSSLTIIAAAGNGPEDGLPGVHGTLRTEQLRVQLGQSTLVHYVDVLKEVERSKWNSRGWTYQEGMLSKRRLIFTQCQVFFQCLSMHCIESISWPLKTLHNSRNVLYEDVKQAVFPSSLSQRSPPEFMYRVNEFIQRDLSVDEDAIDAMRGIFSLFQNLSAPVRTLCGLPLFATSSIRSRKTLSITDQLAAALGWGASKALLRRSAFPSWTWSGWKRGKPELEPGKLLVYFPLLQQLLESSHFEDSKTCHFPLQIEAELGDGTIHDWKIKSKTIMHMSENDNHPRYLHIHGWTFRIPIKRQNSEWHVAPHFPWSIQGTLHFLQLPDEQELEVYEDLERNVVGLVLYVENPYSSIEFLVLYQVSNESTFERLGFLWTIGEEIPSKLLRRPSKLHASCSIGGVQLDWSKICLA